MARHELHQFDLRPAVAQDLISELSLGADASVYEIGPGTGSLTAAMLDAGARICAVEIDAERAAALRQRFAAAIADGRLQLLCGDAHLLMPLFDGPWRIIANPPFQHTASLLRHCLLEDLPAGPPQRLDLVLQRQAAEKWCGAQDEQTRSSVLAHLWGEPQIGRQLQRSDVEPASHVDLCTFSLTRHADGADPGELRCVDTLLELAFAGAHSVRAALRKVSTPAILKKQAAMHKWQPDAHPRSLTPQAWQALASFLRSINKI